MWVWGARRSDTWLSRGAIRATGALPERTEDGRQFKLLVVLDEFTREALVIEVGRSFTVQEVILTLQFLFCSAWSTAAHSI